MLNRQAHDSASIIGVASGAVGAGDSKVIAALETIQDYCQVAIKRKIAGAGYFDAQDQSGKTLLACLAEVKPDISKTKDHYDASEIMIRLMERGASPECPVSGGGTVNVFELAKRNGAYSGRSLEARAFSRLNELVDLVRKGDENAAELFKNLSSSLAKSNLDENARARLSYANALACRVSGTSTADRDYTKLLAKAIDDKSAIAMFEYADLYRRKLTLEIPGRTVTGCMNEAIGILNEKKADKSISPREQEIFGQIVAYAGKHKIPLEATHIVNLLNKADPKKDKRMVADLITVIRNDKNLRKNTAILDCYNNFINRCKADSKFSIAPKMDGNFGTLKCAVANVALRLRR